MPFTLQQYEKHIGLLPIRNITGDILGNTTIQYSTIAPHIKQLIDTASNLFQDYNPTHVFTLTYGAKSSIWRRMNHFHKWIDNLERLQHRPLGWLRADEMRYSGCGYPAIPAHHHGILFNGIDLNIKNGESIWHSMAGDALITPYDPDGRAIPYSLKQAFCNSGDWDIGGLKGVKRLR